MIAEPVRKISTWIPVSSALIEDAGYFRDRISLILAGFHGVRCSECGRRLRCAYAIPSPIHGWLEPRYLGRSCYAKAIDLSRVEISSMAGDRLLALSVVPRA